MRGLIVAEFITLDGMIRSPGAANEDTDGRLLGGGKRLFPAATRLDLALVEASPLPSGVGSMRFRRSTTSRDVQTAREAPGSARRRL